MVLGIATNTTTLLEQYETARVNEALRANSIYVVEPANLPGRPTSPRVEVNLALGLLGGLILGVALAFLLDNLDTRLRTREQIEAAVESPAIGEIPAARDKLQLVHSNNGHRVQTEAFRRLRINILASGEGVAAQTVVINMSDASKLLR